IWCQLQQKNNGNTINFPVQDRSIYLHAPYIHPTTTIQMSIMYSTPTPTSRTTTRAIPPPSERTTHFGFQRDICKEPHSSGKDCFLGNLQRPGSSLEATVSDSLTGRCMQIAGEIRSQGVETIIQNNGISAEGGTTLT
ncbi:MAG: hypothetical protein M1816_003583, partial [Peltula sp. TS41687]